MGRFVVKNVNFFLVFMLLLAVGFVLGMSVYYERKFDDQTTDYVTALSRMQQAEKYQSMYLDAIKSLNTTSQSIQFYDKLYTNKTTELEQTKKTMTDEIGSLKSKLDYTEKQLKLTQDSVNAKVKTISALNSDIDDLETNIDTLDDSLTAMTTKYNDAKDKWDYWEDRANDFQDSRDACRDKYPGCDD